MTNGTKMSMLEPLNVKDYLDKFNGESVKIYNSSDELLGKGKLIISFIEFTAEQYKAMESSELKIYVKDLDTRLCSGEYKLISIIEDEDFFSLSIDLAKLDVDSGKLNGKIHFSKFTITQSDSRKYGEFIKYTQKLNWEEIRLPEEYAGKDKVDEAGAFEALCLDIIEHWGGKNLEIIGKGPDRARDGEFKISAHSWIPIVTDYSNDWVLQCKYSKGYENIQISEIYKEITKVLMHKPDYFLLMTNRKVTNDFKDWFEKALKDNKYHIPFKCILINKTQLEQILADPNMSYIKRRYFD